MMQSQARLEAISDGIFAFAATLVVVSLDVPDSYAELRASFADVGSFAVSFIALVMLWVTHYNFFRRTTIIDGWIIAYNFGMLFVMLCYIFPLKFLAKLTFGGATINNHMEMMELFQLYGLGFSLVFLFVALLYRRAAKKELASAAYLHYWKRHFLIFFGIGILSILLATFSIGMRFGVPGMIYSLLGPLCYWHGKSTGVDPPSVEA
ncbi:TMEM175 family protein [Neolewinella persica]|uniref:TMEM175 family protein n=1 Tax=Neolewinella persica TaxID=70998 RepID=UPI000365E568|nr:TMEM175 family protein [Neolewinella persica]